MLQRNMIACSASALGLELEDVLGNLHDARRTGDLGRLAFLTYWEVRRWARSAHRDALAARAADVVLSQPRLGRAAFLELVDSVIDELERIRAGMG